VPRPNEFSSAGNLDIHTPNVHSRICEGEAGRIRSSGADTTDKVSISNAAWSVVFVGWLESSLLYVTTCQAAAAAGSGSAYPVRRGRRPNPLSAVHGTTLPSVIGHGSGSCCAGVESFMSSSSSSNLPSGTTAAAVAAAASASTPRHPPPPPAEAGASVNASTTAAPAAAAGSPAIPRKIKKKKNPMDAKPPAAKKRRVSSVDVGPGTGKGKDEEEGASGGSRRTHKSRTQETATAPRRPPGPIKLSPTKRLVLLLPGNGDGSTTTQPLRRHELPPALQPWHDRVAEHLWSRAVALTLRSHPLSYRLLVDDDPTSTASDASAIVPHRRALESVLDLDSCEREDWRLRLMWGVGLRPYGDHDDHDRNDDPSPHLQRSTFDVLWRSVGERLRHRLDPMQQRSEEDSSSSGRSVSISAAAAASRPQGSRANNDSTGAASAPPAPSSTTKRRKSSRLLTAQELADEIARQFDASYHAVPPGQALFSPW
jgi:hypothetical protein